MKTCFALSLKFMVVNWTTHLRGRGTGHGATEEVTVDWSGTTRSQHQSSVRWFNGVGFYYSRGLTWSNPVAVADLLQLWTDVEGAAGGRARSGLN